jgi:multiple sugar transport system substrate-binding protein
MATIKDIAKLAGVSQGTVSNVLNGKGIVSSKKIVLVEDAARALGYTINERAKLLRKGSSSILALILPNQRDRQYIDFQISFTAFAESNLSSAAKT